MSNNLQYELNDNVLLSSLAIGDSKAINYIYKSTYPTVEKMVFKMNGSTDDAYDVFQDAVTILYEKAKTNDLQLSCKVSTYLISIAKHLWLKKLSKKKKQQVSVLYDSFEENLSANEDISHFLEFENNVSKLKSCFEQIGEPCKSVLNAFYIHNQSMTDIAQNFGYTNAENAKTQKYKCLNRIRKLFFTEQQKINSNERII
ncbi:MAG: sigma-70 family RNA polymerase sigma factor [Bacteroidetes bacterium]|jgi:RNA polymerase sigma factor (sigma-70 family)|nr:sigma-70 family RNA polymerase sigma factor [Bacteroidota bacterium]HMT34737.1 sigma-70 family RNA polymerase sigma factor [Chitinophagaceae bacterium]MBK7041276.1 sigma-70 family RNA polymerase sigma factor [Bacteroidota bacterium]MBK7588658.1 sigma-70 family RNA polymerase sigma factor [Bacteroidota bacterium]MBK8328653.1 sigma-70 family RNA polymerase sigma factor [Bacteroidota bacterium]